MKRVLFIAFYFPPRNNIACYRSGCFAKFLPEHGWMPTVLCQDWPLDRPDSDSDFVGHIPNSVDIHRIPAPKHRGFYQRVVIRKLAPYLWPHRAPILWWRQARAKMRSLLQSQQFDVIWATSDPLTPLALASEGSAVARVAWVADIRDCLNVQRFGSWYKRPFFRRQERRLCRAANHVVTVSQGLASVLGEISRRPVSVIPNGFDPTLLPVSMPEPTPVFTILYAGTLVSHSQNPGLVFRALELCIRRQQMPRDEVEVQFLGARPELVEKARSKTTDGLRVRTLPRVPHQDALAAQMSASVLLLLAHAEERGVMTGKIFDYLAAGRPILAVPDDRETTAVVLRETGAGVALTSVEDIARQLADWYAAWKRDRTFNLRRDEHAIAQYSRQEQAKQLAGLFNQLTRR